MLNDYSKIFDNMKDGVCLFNEKGEIIYLNPSLEEIFDVKKDDTIGKKIVQIISPNPKNDPFIQLFLDSIYNKKEFHEGFAEYVSFNGSTLKLRVSTSYFDYSSTKGFVAIITDLTELNKVYSTFAKYTSEEIVDEVMHKGMDTLGGKTQNVSILMSDLRGFTALSSKLSPTDLILMLNHYFSSMSEIISKYKGTQLELLGDAIFCVFGAPIKNPDHATLAVSCALEMQNMMKEVNIWNKENNFPDLEMGIGISTGDCVLGNIGSINSMKYACMGSTVNTTGRIESLTVGGQVFISDFTKRQISSKLDIKSIQVTYPKGCPDPIKIYEITGIHGKYDINSNLIEDEIINLSNHIRVPFRVLNEKFVEDEIFISHLEKLSNSKIYFKAKKKFNVPCDIMFDISGDLYAKIISKEGEYYIAKFTSKPTNFDDWFKNSIKNL